MDNLKSARYVTQEREQMKNPSLMVFGCNTRRPILKKILGEARIMNIRTSFNLYSEISLNIGDGFQFFLSGKPLDAIPDIVILDWPGPYLPFRNILADYFSRENSFVLNGSSVLKWSSLNKLAQTYELNRMGIPTIMTNCSGNSTTLIQETINRPMIIKAIFGAEGDEVFKVASSNAMKDVLRIYNPEELLLQPVIKDLTEFRVVVIGDHAVAAVEKEPALGDFRGNKAKGAKFITVQIPPLIEEVSVKSCKTFECDFAGIDVFWDGFNLPMVIEVNRYLEIGGVEEATGLNVSYMLLDWIRKKIEKQNVI